MQVERGGVWLEMADDVIEELDDERFLTRQHYSRATYAQGCRGPLCRLSEAHRERKRSEARAKAAGREYKPNGALRKTDRDEELAPIIAWHLNERSVAPSLR